jgi:alkanesulfonate monooxygenase SsuD/methylene tetrahydromethanopterin reductase-like flavin-dependent oxidoreductase (luciferase family)
MMIRLGGEIADGVQTITPLAYMEFIKEQMAKGAKKGGRDPSEIELQSAGSLAIDRDRNEAINLAKYNLTWVIPDSPDILLEKIGVKREEANHIAEVREKEGREVAMQLVTDKMVDAIAVAGNPEEIIKKLVAKVRAGVSSLVFASPMGKDKFEALRILGEEVIPAVRSEL